MKKITGPILRTPRSPRSNDLEIRNDENSKWKLVKTRWNPKFGLSDLENDLLTSASSEGAQVIFQKLHFWNQCIATKKMRHVIIFWSKFSLNISTEEVWFCCIYAVTPAKDRILCFKNAGMFPFLMSGNTRILMSKFKFKINIWNVDIKA